MPRHSLLGIRIGEFAVEPNDTVDCQVNVRLNLEPYRRVASERVKLYIEELPSRFRIPRNKKVYPIGRINPGKSALVPFTVVTHNARVGWHSIRFRLEYYIRWKGRMSGLINANYYKGMLVRSY